MTLELTALALAGLLQGIQFALMSVPAKLEVALIKCPILSSARRDQP